MDTLFGAAQAYVIFGRVQALHQLYLSNFDPKVIKVSQEAKEEAQRISEVATSNVSQYWMPGWENCRIISLNTRSLMKHISDIHNHFILLKCNILCVNETFLPNHGYLENIEIKDFSLTTCGKGRGRGQLQSHA